MSGSSFGHLFRVTTFGESHGAAIGCVIDGCPAGFKLDLEAVQTQLDRRRPGRSAHTTQRQELDACECLSGLFEGVTTGAPIALLIHNHDARSRDYDQLKDTFRPGHADWTYEAKYGLRDHRGGGRSSARETAARVAAGAVARQLLQASFGIEIYGWLSQIGTVRCSLPGIHAARCHDNDFFWPNPDQVEELQAYIYQIRRDGDSVGARAHVCATAVPAGLGDPVFERLDARLAFALMSINAVKGVEIGDGFGCVSQRGSTHRDELTPQGFSSNHAGGILGGISSGQDIIASLAFKPAASIRIEGDSIDRSGKPVKVRTTGRHDPCVGIRGVPVAEAMVALVLVDALLRQGALGRTPRIKAF